MNINPILSHKNFNFRYEIVRIKAKQAVLTIRFFIYMSTRVITAVACDFYERWPVIFKRSG